MRSVKPSSRKYLGGNVYARSDENSEQGVGLCVRLHMLLVVRVVVVDNDDDDDDDHDVFRMWKTFCATFSARRFFCASTPPVVGQACAFFVTVAMQLLSKQCYANRDPLK